MTPFETATAFFHSCESLKGWAECQQYTADNALFFAQSEPIADLSKVAEYCDWLADLGKGPLKGCGYTLHSSSYDEANHTALFFATFNGTHTSEGGPVSVTQQSTASHYVYAIGNYSGQI